MNVILAMTQNIEFRKESRGIAASPKNRKKVINFVMCSSRYCHKIHPDIILDVQMAE